MSDRPWYDDNIWCANACQPLYGLGECCLCGYGGEGVHFDELFGGPLKDRPMQDAAGLAGPRPEPEAPSGRGGIDR